MVVCDYCGDEVAVFVVKKGAEKGDKLCEDCADDFIDAVRDEYLEDI